MFEELPPNNRFGWLPVSYLSPEIPSCFPRDKGGVPSNASDEVKVEFPQIPSNSLTSSQIRSNVPRVLQFLFSRLSGQIQTEILLRLLLAHHSAPLVSIFSNSITYNFALKRESCAIY